MTESLFIAEMLKDHGFFGAPTVLSRCYLLEQPPVALGFSRANPALVHASLHRSSGASGRNLSTQTEGGCTITRKAE